MGRFTLTLTTVILATATAHAEPRVKFELGYLWDRVAVTDQTAIDGRLVRFSFSVNFHAFHAGAEVDDSWMSGTTTVSDGAIARTMTVPAGSPLTGTMVAPKVYVGLHTNGRISLAGELAGGLRDTSVSSDLGDDIGGRKMSPLIEARTRLDVWVAPSWSLGAVASADMLFRNNLAVGLMLASHL